MASRLLSYDRSRVLISSDSVARRGLSIIEQLGQCRV
jgi:hypothetical protein